jgi:hypothetical protein
MIKVKVEKKMPVHVKVHKLVDKTKCVNKTVPGKVATTRTEEGHKQDT